MSRSLLENVTDISKDPFITFCICVLTVAVCLDTMWGCPVKLVYSPVITAISGCFTQRKYHLTRDLTRKVRVFEFFDKWIPAEYRFHLVLNIVKVEPQHKTYFWTGEGGGHNFAYSSFVFSNLSWMTIEFSSAMLVLKCSGHCH